MSEPHPLAPASDDLLSQDAVRDAVRGRYRAVVGQSTDVAPDLYAPELLALAPDAAVDAALGVGNPLARASLVRGETVIDLGCGAGIDTIIAARLVAPTGRAIGLDTLPEMLERGHENAATATVTNIEWLRGEIESIPMSDASVDVIISNGVLNLSPRKGRAMAEMYRVLRSGGRMSVADIVLDEELPPEVMSDPDAWAG